MPGRHRGSVVLGPKFTIPTIRHGNRNRAGNRASALGGETLLLLPDDDDPAVTRRPGRHRRTERQNA